MTEPTNFYFCTGGCRSGKSVYGQRLTEILGDQRVFMATAAGGDDSEMQKRIRLHRMARGAGWRSVEPADGLWENPGEFVREKADAASVLLFDCLTLWVAGCLERPLTDAIILERCTDLLDALKGRERGCVLVSNEVGMGLVPESPLGRRFRDLAGQANQMAGEKADTAVLLVSGLPLALKGTLPLI